MDLFDTYRKMFAGPAGEEIVWWYCGVVLSEREGLGRIPLTQAETLMVYRTTDIDADTFTIDWTEVGYFRDINSGERMEGWFNPFGFATEPYPKSFVDGPATFTVVRQGTGGVDIALVQHNARIDGVSLERSINAATVGLVQTEKKARTFTAPTAACPPSIRPRPPRSRPGSRSGARPARSTTHRPATCPAAASTAAAQASPAAAAPGPRPPCRERCARPGPTSA